MNIAKHPVAEHSADAGLGFAFQQIEERRHRVTHRFPTGRHIGRRAQIDRVVPVAGKRSGFDQAGRHAGLEQFAIPLPVGRSHQCAGFGSCDHLFDRLLYFYECCQ